MQTNQFVAITSQPFATTQTRTIPARSALCIPVKNIQNSHELPCTHCCGPGCLGYAGSGPGILCGVFCTPCAGFIACYKSGNCTDVQLEVKNIEKQDAIDKTTADKIKDVCICYYE
ncbi:MAG: hypothetical protein ACRCWB_10290 [Enterovibrio sp.]